MPPNIIPIILAFYFLNGNNNNKYHDNSRCINVSQENNFNLLVILILIIIYYSNSIPEANLTYINATESENIANGSIKRTPNEGINKESNGTNDDTKKAAAKSIQNTVNQSKNTQNTASQSKSNNNGNSTQAISKHIGKQEEFTYANKEVKSSTRDCSISKYINNDYQGATVTALLSNGTTVTGDVTFTFEDIVSLKTKDNIIFISSKDIVSFY